jgi:hypothetical protein
MTQAATDLVVLGWKSIVAFVVGIPILSAGAIYLMARLTSVFDTYATERAKLLAQFHNLNRLIEQTEKLTATTETIKAEIQHKVWETQTTLTLKRDIYTRLLEAVGQMIEDHQESKYLESMRKTKFRDMPELADQHKASVERLSETMQKWNRAVDVAPILISDEAYALLPTILHGLIPEQYDHNIEHLKASRYRLQQAARADFGMTKLALEKPL